MKKLYSLIASVVVAATMNAQATFTETFDNSPASTTATGYTDNNFVGVNNITWTYVQARGDMDIDNGTVSTSGNKALMLAKNKTPNASLTSSVIPAGYKSFSFDFNKAFSTDTAIQVYVSQGGGAETLVYTAVTATKANSGALTLDPTKDVIVKFVNSGRSAGQAIIDNITFTSNTLAVSDVNAAKLNFVKNTIVGNQITFGEKSDVKIINMNGQVVKAASVDKNSNLDVSSLAKGVYIVTGQVDGKAVSQKVVKQ